ncbi:helix-turn-helix transcriptional regulator [Umezawaea beigongshangensis]|uniref:helix-turn-helix transcriptional regulator n=1 Tax=Umezawaea beigongshangensis TaxID=2780383 RepID=UPI0018F22FFE|nr:LuxR family transcriptional regulator [Umezawaea beigongshangensis]
MHVVSGEDRPFVGRQHERELLTGLVSGTGGAVVVRGEAGVGKTALLERVAATVPRVLRVRGVESEASLPFAVAADLLLPLRDVFERLPEVQRDALEVSLSLVPGAVASPLAACAGALGVLTAAGERQPLLVVVDDFQWVDPPSQQLLLFVARRLAWEGVFVALAVRDQPGSYALALDLPTVALEGLSARECRELVAALGVDVPPRVLDRIVERTGGNPLAVVETVSASPSVLLHDAGPGAPAPERPVLGPVLHRTWSRVVDALPERTRVALCVVAASGAPGDVAEVLAALGGSLDDLFDAQHAGLVRVLPGGLRLRHPLLRQVVEERVPRDVLGLVHRTLADRATGHQRAWYLAAPLTAPDDAAADDLVAAVSAEPVRFGPAARSWHRAAELTSDPRRAADRLLAAAARAHAAGEAHPALSWCDEALALRADPAFAADVEVVRSRARAALGDPLHAAEGLVRAAVAVLPVDSSRAAALHVEAALSAVTAGDVRRAVALVRRADEIRPAGEVPPAAEVVAATALLLDGRAAEAAARLRAVASFAELADPVHDQLPLVLLARCSAWLEDAEGARPVLGRVLEAGRRAGAPVALPLALAHRAELGWWSGHWAAAATDAGEGLRWAEEMAQTDVVGRLLSTLGRLDAARGDAASSRRRIERARRAAGGADVELLRTHVPAVLGLAALGEGDPDTAARHLGLAWEHAGETGWRHPGVALFVGDLVESLIRTGEAERARDVLTVLEERADATGLAHPAAVAARGRGALSDDADTAEEHFARATTLHSRLPTPFERARTLLCRAETLRRLRRPLAARSPLREALATFQDLGARPWAARAETELAATGARADVGGDTGRTGLEVLTPQEFQTARAVADGMNNTEAAAALFISRKTVEAHLTRTYRKLGIRSRTELTRRFASPARAQA